MKSMRELTIKEALVILQQYGSRMGEKMFRSGIESGVFSEFAVFIPPNKNLNKEPGYYIYESLLMSWIKKRLHDVPENDAISEYDKVFGG